MESRLGLLPRYVKTFGLPGFWTFVCVELARCHKIKVRGISFPVYLRRNSSDVKVFREVFLFRSYAIKIEPPKTLLDGGANIGLASVFFANLYPHALIIAVEPDEENFRALKRNTALYPNIRPEKTALWPTSTFLRIQNTNDSGWAFQVAETSPEDSGAFKASSIPQVMEDFGISHIDLLKLDVEGAEYELFHSHYEQWLEHVNHIVIEFHDWAKPESSRSVYRTIAQYPFTTTVLNGMLLFSRIE